MPEEEFYGLLKICDVFNLVELESSFVQDARSRLANHPLMTEADLEQLGEGLSGADLEARTQAHTQALPLYLREGRQVGLMHAAHEADGSLAADVLLENLTCKATAVMAMRTLLTQEQIDPTSVSYVLNSGEEAVGDRYQRGGGNLPKRWRK